MAYKALALWNFAGHGSRLDAIDAAASARLAGHQGGAAESSQGVHRQLIPGRDGIDAIDP